MSKLLQQIEEHKGQFIHKSTLREWLKVLADNKENLITSDAVNKFGVYGCHVDLYDDQTPDDCVINTGETWACIFADKDMLPCECEHWKKIEEG